MPNILCFSTSVKEPATANALRDFIESTCRAKNTTLYSRTSQFHKSDIPPGNWTIAFAPRVVKEAEWVVVFAAPNDSETVWLMYPGKNGFLLERDVKLHFEDLVKKGKVKMEEPMRVGDERHQTFMCMVEHAVWAAENVPFEDWRSAEYTRVV